MCCRLKEHVREQRDHDCQLDRERAAERDRLLMEAQHETSAGIERLSRNIANSPRLSRHGTPTGTPVPAVDDRPKPAPRKTPTKADPTVRYQAADRHPGSAEPTPAPHRAAKHGLADCFRPLGGPPPQPPREVAPPCSSPPPVARITTPPSQCRPPKPDPSPVTNTDQLVTCHSGCGHYRISSDAAYSHGSACSC